MKFLLLSIMLLAAGCTSSNQYGRCVGLNGHEDPKMEYEYSAWNIAVGIVFVEMVIPPVIVGLNELKCPVGPK